MMISTTSLKKTLKKIARWLVVLLFWLAVWQAASWWLGKPWLLPAPPAVALRALELLPTREFWQVVAHTLARIGSGFALGVAAGLVLAVLTRSSRLAAAVLSPALKAVLSTPVASFTILLLVWLKASSVPVMVAFLVVMPVTWRQLDAGIAATDKQLLEMARLFRLSLPRKIRRIYIPSLKPHFLAACSSGLGLAWKSGVAAEVISLPQLAIGSSLQTGRVYLQLADVFVWTITVIALSLLLEALMLALFKSRGNEV